jgi:hypothetical protein
VQSPLPLLALLLSLLSLTLHAQTLSIGQPLSSDPLENLVPKKRVPARSEAGRAGLWGKLDLYTVFLEAPREIIELATPAETQTLWTFEKHTRQDVHDFLRQLQLPADILQKLDDETHWSDSGSSTILRPDDETLRSIPSEPRARLYNFLGRFLSNPLHREPEIFYGESPEQWLSDAGLPQNIVSAIAEMTYLRGSKHVFADTPAVLALAESDHERVRIQQALSRSPNLMAKVKMSPDEPVQTIARWWTANGLLGGNIPLIKSLLASGMEDSVDITRFLPPAAKKIIFTYPSPLDARSGHLPDCHWSALNFFNDPPLDRLSDPRIAATYVRENFEPINSEPQFGDVIFFMDPSTKEAHHSCVYLADDIVYTKNGRSLLEPWVFMHLSEVRDIYGMHMASETVVYRRKKT